MVSTFYAINLILKFLFDFKMQSMIISGKLPCSKDESVTLAALSLRIFEINLFKKINDLKSQNQFQKENLREEKEQNEDISRVSYSNYISNNNDCVKNIIEEEKEIDLISKTSKIKDKKSKNKESLGTNISVISTDLIPSIDIPILKKNGVESILLCFKKCAFTNNESKFIFLNQLVPPCYHRSSDIIKSIKNKKDKLINSNFFNNEIRLKEYYVKLCRNLNCFGCVLFQVKEIIFDSEEASKDYLKTFKRTKRLLAIKPNKISLIDYKTKQLVKTQRMADLKSWFSGDGYYNLTPLFLANSASTPLVNIDDPAFNFHTKLKHNILHNLFRTGKNSLDMNKLFVIEFRNYKWHLQIDNFHSLKSITCILLDQSLDMGIDNNPLMLDLTIGEHNNRYKLFEYKNSSKNQNLRFNSNTSKKRHTQSSGRVNLSNSVALQDKKSAVSNNSSNNSKNLSNKNDPGASPSVSIIAQRNHSLANLDQDQNSDFLIGSFSIFGEKSLNRNNPLASIFSKNSYSYGYGTRNNFYGSSRPCFKYEKEFQQLQIILLWFPEEVAIRLTEVEYEIFKKIPPSEYLRHAILDMNNFKYNETNNCNHLKNSLNLKVQDLIVRYKEVSLTNISLINKHFS